MQTIGLSELQTQPDRLSHSFQQDDYLLIMQSGKPVGVALPFSHHLLEQGLKPWMALKAFQTGDLSLGQVAKALGKTKAETMSLLSSLNIPIADYDLQEDLDALDRLFPNG